MTKPLEGDLEPQVVATRNEMISAWKALSTRDRKVLVGLAAKLTKVNQYADRGMTWEDLMQDAVIAVLEGRRTWAMNKITFTHFMCGILRSLAADLGRTNAGKLRTESAQDDGELEQLQGGLNPETFLLERERENALKVQFAALQEAFQDDEAGFYVLECMLEGLWPRETRERLGMSEKDFDAARNRITRRIRSMWRPN